MDLSERELSARLEASLRSGTPVRTPFGLFWAHRLEGGEFHSPTTGEPIPVPAKRATLFLPSDAFLRDVLEQNHVTERALRADLEADGFPVPASAAVELAVPGLYAQVVAELREQDEAFVPNFGEFQVFSSRTLQRGIRFRLDEALRARLARI